MMVDPKLICRLRCPIDGTPLHLASDSLVESVNQAIAAGEKRDRHDQKISSLIEGGLVDQQGNRLYPIRGGIPTLVADEAIDVHG
ncbi:MAG: Trm112 family protein [Rubripirellula sp.]